METSSPLAAMRPGAPSFGQQDLFHPHAHMASNHVGPGSLHLRDQFAMQHPHPDYFNIKSIRGSSPTASLAADLSQNFNIAESRLELSLFLFTFLPLLFPHPSHALLRSVFPCLYNLLHSLFFQFGPSLPVIGILHANQSVVRSPHFPTPRRALFTSAKMMGAIDARGKPPS